MPTDKPQGSVLIGKSQLVLDDSVAGLRDLGYKAEGTNDFADVTARFDARDVDVVVFGGQVPPDRKAELREEIGAINPRVIFVQGLAGIPALIINQVQGAFAADHQEVEGRPTFTPDDRSIRLTLPGPADVKVTIWWQTSFVPPDPKSDSPLLLDDRLAAGDHVVTVPDLVPPKAVVATVQIDVAIHASASPLSLNRMCGQWRRHIFAFYGNRRACRASRAIPSAQPRCTGPLRTTKARKRPTARGMRATAAACERETSANRAFLQPTRDCTGSTKPAVVCAGEQVVPARRLRGLPGAGGSFRRPSCGMSAGCVVVLTATARGLALLAVPVLLAVENLR